LIFLVLLGHLSQIRFAIYNKLSNVSLVAKAGHFCTSDVDWSIAFNKKNYEKQYAK